jgi:hypothetical protein
MIKIEQCEVSGCCKTAAATFDNLSTCRSHFIGHCYEELDRYERLIKGTGLTIADAEIARRFVSECTRQADEMEHHAADLDNLDRAKLLHIILSASELGRHLRRSPRKVAAIPVRIGSEKFGGMWQEDAQTVLLSRCGASVSCKHPAKPGETIQLIRADTGKKVSARVAWQRFFGLNDLRIGVEFLDCENFWGLDWALVEDARNAGLT